MGQGSPHADVNFYTPTPPAPTRYTSGMVQRLPAYIGDEVEYTATDPQCLDCLWFRGAGRCDAFPKGIPDAIYLNLADHRQPHPGDNGIRWEPLPGVEVDPDE